MKTEKSSHYQKKSPTKLFSKESLFIAITMPWKAYNTLHRLAILPWVRLKFAAVGVEWKSGWRIYGSPILQIHRDAIVRIGSNIELRSTVRSNPLGPNHAVILSVRRPNASLIIGNQFAMTGGCIVVEENIHIGNRVTIGANCTIIDTDFHPIDYQKRQETPLDGATSPIIIEDDVFVGMSSIILKGVTVGARSVIGAGSIVTSDVPQDTVVAGNPARVVHNLA